LAIVIAVIAGLFILESGDKIQLTQTRNATLFAAALSAFIGEQCCGMSDGVSIIPGVYSSLF